MSPYARAYQHYLEHPQHNTFSEYCGWHLQHGFLFSTPDFFIMGRAAVKKSLEDIGPTWGAEHNPDTWYIFMMAGDPSKAWSILPYYLPWIAFERLRGGKLVLTIVSTNRLRNVSEIIT